MDEITLIIVAISVLFLLLCFTISSLLYVCGLLSSVDVGAGPPPIKDAVVAYKFATGPYKYSGDLFNEVARVMPDNTPIGIYYDNPDEVPKEKLRYAVGAILSEGKVKIEKDLVMQVEAEGFKLINLPEVSNCVKSSFPYVNTLSILIAVWKVYPRLGRYIRENKLCAYPMVEVYQKDCIQFMAPLSKQDDFFVEETQSSDDSLLTGDDSILDSTYNSEGTPTFCDESPSSSCSRSVSSFSYSSKRLLEAFTDDESNESEEEPMSPSIQDEEVTSSVEVRASKARTNLLSDSDDEVEKEESKENVSVAKNDSTDEIISSPAQVTGLSDSMDFHDSGIASGRTSTVPTDSPGAQSNLDPGDESSSSFEEIHMEDTVTMPTEGK